MNHSDSKINCLECSGGTGRLYRTCSECNGSGELNQPCSHGYYKQHYVCPHIPDLGTSMHKTCEHNTNGVQHD